MCGAVTSRAAKRTSTVGRPPELALLSANSATRTRYVAAAPSDIRRDVGRRIRGGARLAGVRAPAADLFARWDRARSRPARSDCRSAVTATRSTAASGTATEYHMLRNPTMLVHEGSGSASSGPVVALAPFGRLHDDVLERRQRRPAQVEIGCAAALLVVQRRRGLRARRGHEARAGDRKQSHERDGDASGHVGVPSWGGSALADGQPCRSGGCASKPSLESSQMPEAQRTHRSPESASQ